MWDYIYNKLKRQTSTGLFMPEIDGLRFVAVILVVLYHVNVFFTVKSPFVWDFAGTITNFLYSNGFKGVEIFFVISGFVLALPFAKQYILGERKVELKRYYFRRLTRLEPPYFIILLFFLALHVVKGVYPLNDLLRGLVENVFYIHNFAIFNNAQSVIGMVGWTLELEVQFYLLAPLFAKVFVLPRQRRLFWIIFLIIIFPLVNIFFTTTFVWLFNYIFYFAIGFLLAELYVTKSKIEILTRHPVLYSIFSFAALYLANIYTLYGKYIITVSLFVFIYLALTETKIKTFFSLRFFTIIGGMCYSIYLVHTVVISGIGNWLVQYRFGDSYLVNLLIHSVVLGSASLIIGSIFFVFFEKPFMDKNWPTKIYSKLKALLSRGDRVISDNIVQ